MGRRNAMQLAGSKGGKTRAARLSREELSESGKKAINARWEKYRAEKAAAAAAEVDTAEKAGA